MTTTVINRTVRYEKTLKHMECCNCSVDFALGAHFIAERRKDHGTFYCPNGHPQGWYGPKARYAKGQVTKIKRRIANGICPCCNRTNLAEHMVGQHPDFIIPTDTTEETTA